MSQRLKSVIETNLPHRLEQAEQKLISSWITHDDKARSATKLYEHLRQETGALVIRNLRKELNFNHYSYEAYMVWLEDKKFVNVNVCGKKRIIDLNPIPEPTAEDLGLRPLGLETHLAKDIDGNQCSPEISPKEQSVLLSYISSFGFDRTKTRALATLYANIRQISGTYYMSDLIIDTGGWMKLKSFMKSLKDMNLVNRAGDMIIVFPVIEREFMNMYTEDEVHIWLLSAQAEVSKSVGKIPVASTVKLLALYNALLDYRGTDDSRYGMFNRRTAVAILRGCSYEDVRPHLVFFMLRPEYFSGMVKKRVENFGVNLLTFYKNMNAISDECLAESRIAGADYYWQSLLARNESLVRFITE